MSKTPREIALEEIIRDIIWMARRYADGRSTYAPDMFNRAADRAIQLGITWKHDKNGEVYATDGMFGNWNSDLQRFVKKEAEDE